MRLSNSHIISLTRASSLSQGGNPKPQSHEGGGEDGTIWITISQMVPGSGNGNGKDATKHHPQLENVMLLRRTTASSARGPPFVLSILNPVQYESESKAIFGALNLNPQLFYNEVLNIVNNVLDKAFNIFYQ